jgi:hypothetical protein
MSATTPTPWSSPPSRNSCPRWSPIITGHPSAETPRGGPSIITSFVQKRQYDRSAEATDRQSKSLATTSETRPATLSSGSTGRHRLRKQQAGNGKRCADTKASTWRGSALFVSGFHPLRVVTQTRDLLTRADSASSPPPASDDSCREPDLSYQPPGKPQHRTSLHDREHSRLGRVGPGSVAAIAWTGRDRHRR